MILLADYEKAIKYLNHKLSMNELESIDTKMLPFSFKSLIKNNMLVDLEIYNSWFIHLLINNSSSLIDKNIVELFENLTEENRLNIMGLISPSFINKLIIRERNAYTLSRGDVSNEKLSKELLLSYSYKYENTELLIMLMWIAESLNMQVLTKDFSKFQYKDGTYKKGNIINYILKKFEGNDKFYNLVETSYNRKFRNMTSHNDFYLSEDKLTIIDINHSSNQISKQEFIDSFYSLQQLTNMIKFLVFDYESEKAVKNFSGIIGAFSIINHPNILYIYQLQPFYELDIKKGESIKNINIVRNGSNLVSLYFNNLCIVKDLVINSYIRDWIKNPKKRAKVISVSPNVYDVENNSTILVDNEYLFINSGYWIENIKLSLVSNFNM